MTENELRNEIDTNATPVESVRRLEHRVGGQYFVVTSEVLDEPDEALRSFEDKVPVGFLVEAANVTDDDRVVLVIHTV